MGSGIPLPNVDLEKAKDQIFRLLAQDKEDTKRAEAILEKILSKNARVYGTDKIANALPAIAVVLASEESGGRRANQKTCQQESGLGPKLFKHAVEMCRAAKNLDESKINFVSLAEKFEREDALPYAEKILAHFRKSCFDARIVDEKTWGQNQILVICAVFCWVCDRTGSNAPSRGPEVAFHCGLGWENVQKSMYYNLNPHCTMRMEALKKEVAETSLNGVAKAGSGGRKLPPAALPLTEVQVQDPSASGTISNASLPSASRNSSSRTPAPPSASGSLSAGHSADRASNGVGESDGTPEIVYTGMSGPDHKRKAEDDDNSKAPPKKRGRRDKMAASEEAFMIRPAGELYFSPSSSEVPADMELRVYYAWKRFMVDASNGLGPTFGEGAIRDFVMT